MPDPRSDRVPSTPVVIAKTFDSAGTFLKKAVEGVARSVEHDGATVVSGEATPGARIEAGLNVLADGASVLTGPEDAVIERGAVFAVKETVEHAPELARTAEGLGSAIEPRVGKAGHTVFDSTKALLERAGHEVELNPARGMIETKNTVYHIIEGVEVDARQLNFHEWRAFTSQKNFAIHAPNLTDSAIHDFEHMGTLEISAKIGMRAELATTTKTIEHSIAALEHGNVLHKRLTQAQDLIDNVAKPLDTGKNLLEIGGTVTKAITVTVGAGTIGYNAVKEVIDQIPGDVRHAATSAVQHVAESVRHAGAAASADMQHVLAGAEHVAEGANHGIEATGNALGNAAKSVADRLHHWTPDMPMEDFHKLLATSRGGGPASARGHEAPTQHLQPQHDHGLSH